MLKTAKVRMPDGRIEKIEVDENATPQEIEALAQNKFSSQIGKVPLPDGRVGLFRVGEGTTLQEVEAFARDNLSSFGGGTPAPGAASDIPPPDVSPGAPQTTPSVSELMMSQVPGLTGAKALAETGLQGLGAAAGQFVGGLAGAGTLATGGGLEKAGERLAGAQKFFEYQPKSKEAQQLGEVAAFPPTKLIEATEKYVADPIAEAGYPNVAAGVKTAIEGGTELASMALGAKGVKPSITKLKAAAAESTLENLPIKRKKVVIDTINKVLKPPTRKKGTPKEIEIYDNKALTGVEEIIKNKENLGLLDEYQRTKLPESLDDMQNAVAQTERTFFEEYDSYARESDRLGGAVDITPAAKALDEIIEKPAFKKYGREIIEYAKKRKEETLSGDTKLSAVDTQDNIQLLNRSLEAFYDNRSTANYGESLVDSVVANNLRKSLDDTIMNTTGEAYQLAKNKYGAVKSLRDDVARAANKERNKATGVSTIDFADVFAAHHVARGLSSFNPGKAAPGIIMETANIARKIMKDPNRKVKKMFKTAEDSMLKQQRLGGQ